VPAMHPPNKRRVEVLLIHLHLDPDLEIYNANARRNRAFICAKGQQMQSWIRRQHRRNVQLRRFAHPLTTKLCDAPVEVATL